MSNINKQLLSTVLLDKEQLKVWASLQNLAQKLTQKKRLVFYREKIKGIYIWGPVGRGKTMLVNEFYTTLNTQRKIRLHFQHFMKDIHENLFSLSKSGNAITKLVASWANNYDVICLDELYIDDIADAFIIKNLFNEIYKYGISLVITTNIAPDDLYHKISGNRFIDTITLLKHNNEVFKLDNQQDYRLLFNQHNQVFFYGDNQVTTEKLYQFYLNKANNTKPSTGEISVNDRQLCFNAKYRDIIWFEFSELCEKPRSQLDYIELANKFRVILVSNIPQLDDGLKKDDDLAMLCKDRARRFISLIDEFYDRSILLVANFKCSLDLLYMGTDLKFQFQRVQSRLFEMQSLDYLKKPILN